MGAECTGQLPPLCIRFDDDDVARSPGTHPLHRGQTDGSGALHNGDVAETKPARSDGVERNGGRLDLRRLHVVERRIGVHDPRRGNTDSRREAAVLGRQGVAVRVPT